MKTPVQIFLAVQAALFALAAGAHLGVGTGTNDPGAGIAEGVIAIVLLGGLLLTSARPADPRPVALAAQGFALLGTLVGITLVLTVGPTEAFDVTVHSIMLATLIAGLAVTWHAPWSSANPRLA